MSYHIDRQTNRLPNTQTNTAENNTTLPELVVTSFQANVEKAISVDIAFCHKLRTNDLF